ncbi:hypothetical protein ABZY06_33910 [Streptomyces sp. NPDC006540]|uniref:hypothetical protein n=1 Tax=Streptomyces sp. NPDC006540 TaxID=3155353 RepID=UPI0033BF883B
MTYLDTIIRAVEDRILRSGVTEQSTMTGAVSAVATDGTITVTRDSNTYPKVRILAGYVPRVGHAVQIHKAAGGWVCLGATVTTTPAWTAIPLATGWTSWGSPYGACEYRVNGDGTASLSGLAKAAAGLSGVQTIATLPTEARPATKIRLETSVTTTQRAALDINTNGTIQISDYTGNPSWAALDVAVRYRLV